MQIDKYKKRAKHNIAESTLNTRLSGMRKLDVFIGGGEPSVEDVEDWMDHMIEEFEDGNIKSSSIREYYKHVKYYFEVVLNQPDGIDHISKWIPKSDSDPGDYLDEEEWDKLRNSFMMYRDKCMIELMYYYARRPGEIIRLNLEDIDMENGTITFPILKKKDDFRATFEMLPEVKPHLENWLEYVDIDEKEAIEWKGEQVEVTPLFTGSQGRIGYNSFYKKIKRKAKECGIEKNVTPKAMGRHSRATHLDWSGETPGNIARDMLVHDPNTDVIGRYIHDRDEDKVRKTMTTDKENNVDN